MQDWFYATVYSSSFSFSFLAGRVLGTQVSDTTQNRAIILDKESSYVVFCSEFGFDPMLTFWKQSPPPLTLLTHSKFIYLFIWLWTCSFPSLGCGDIMSTYLQITSPIYDIVASCILICMYCNIEEEQRKEGIPENKTIMLCFAERI